MPSHLDGDMLLSLVAARFRGLGYTCNPERVRSDELKGFSTHQIQIPGSEGTYRFRVPFEEDGKPRVDIAYSLDELAVGKEQRPTFSLLKERVDMGKEARSLARISLDSLRISEGIISKAIIEGYDTVDEPKRSALRPFPIPEVLIMRHKIKTPEADSDYILNALWNLGIKPLWMLSPRTSH